MGPRESPTQLALYRYWHATLAQSMATGRILILIETSQHSGLDGIISDIPYFRILFAILMLLLVSRDITATPPDQNGKEVGYGILHAHVLMFPY